MNLAVGDLAPDFSAQDQSGRKITLKNLRGKHTLIYFYPKDETPGCTAQACSLRDNFEQLQTKGIDVIGVSKDNISSHAKFSEHHKLPFPILADSEHKMIEAYGAWGERNFYGKKFFGTIRSAVLVGPDLKILAVWPRIQPLKTVSSVLDWVMSNPL